MICRLLFLLQVLTLVVPTAGVRVLSTSTGATSSLSRHRTLPPVAQIRSTKDLFQWVEHSIEFTAWATSQSVEIIKAQLSGKISSFTLSTAFSGIGEPENALMSIANYLGVGHGDNVFAIEWDQECRRELASLDRPPLCIFHDINDFWCDEKRVRAWWSLENYERCIKSGRSLKLSGQAWCGVHQSYECRLKVASCHLGGTPCPDWSPQGKERGEDGTDLMSTMAWAAMRWELEEDFWVNENVHKFPPRVVLGVLLAKYVIVTAVCKLWEQGWPQRRQRRITIGIHKRNVIVGMEWDRFSGSFRRELISNWTTILYETLEGKSAELAWARSRPSSLYKKTISEGVKKLEGKKWVSQVLDHLSILQDAEVLKSKSDYLDAMTLWEICNVVKYMQMMGDLDACCELGQNPDQWTTIGTDQLLPTIIRNCHMMYSTKRFRWLSPGELLLAQGFAVSPESKVNGEVSLSFSLTK